MSSQPESISHGVGASWMGRLRRLTTAGESGASTASGPVPDAPPASEGAGAAEAGGAAPDGNGAAGGAEAAAGWGQHHRTREPGIVLDCGAGPDVRHVGITFVHGIGSQLAGETLLDWGGALIRVLLNARVRHGASADPVIDTQLDPGPGLSRFIEVQLPAVVIKGEAVPEQHWVLTEAWWAQRVRPPSFGQMVEWLGQGGAIERILNPLLPRMGAAHDARLRPHVEVHPLRRVAGGVEEDDGTVRDTRGGTARMVKKSAGGVYLRAVSAWLLVLYGLLRSIEKILPIGPLKNGALTRPLDRFLLEWFGDVYVLLKDAPQASSIRGRLTEAVSDLTAAGCDEIAVVAHSGGAIVTYMTLSDQSAADLKVDRIITLGEGLNLAWRLEDLEGRSTSGAGGPQDGRLYRDVLATREHLLWDDFWASQDPAPVGVLGFPADRAGGSRGASLARVRSHAVWNRLSTGEDHGGYWDNDEEFLIPVLRLLEGRPGGHGLFGAEADDPDRSRHRRQRLSILSLWRQLAVVAPLAGVVIAFALNTASAFHASDAVAAVWDAIPGSGIVTTPLNTLRAMDITGTVPGLVLAETGVWIVAAAIAGSTAFALIAPPERPVPWVSGRFETSIGRLLRAVPWLAGIPVLAALAYAAWKFIDGSTGTAIDVGRAVGGAAIAVVAVGAVAMVLSRGRRGGSSAPREAVETLAMMVAMAVASAMVVAPLVAILAFPDVGRTVLGTVVILLAFQLLGQAGTWRWSVWDARERETARTGRAYGATSRVAIQAALLFSTQAVLFGAVVRDSPEALMVAVGGLVAIALLGVALDVLDARGRTSS
jgi:hypothetical protein